MQRTKKWWAGLTEDERKKLYSLECQLASMWPVTNSAIEAEVAAITDKADEKAMRPHWMQYCYLSIAGLTVFLETSPYSL